MMPPDAQEQAYQRARAALVAGEMPLDPPRGAATLTLSAWVRGKLLTEALGDLGLALRQLGLSLSAWANAEASYGGLLYAPEMRARYDHLRDRLDMSEAVAAVRAENLRASHALLEPDATILDGPRGPLVVGHVFGASRAPAVRVVDALRGQVVLTSAPLEGTTAPIGRDSYRREGPLLHVAHERVLHGLSLDDGRLVYRATLTEPLRTDLSPRPALLSATPTVLIAACTTELHGIDVASGRSLWSRSLGGGYGLSPAPGGALVIRHGAAPRAELIDATGRTVLAVGDGERLVVAYAHDDRLWLRFHRQHAGGWQSGLCLVESATGARRELEVPLSDGLKPAFVRGATVWCGAKPGELLVVTTAGETRALALPSPELTVRELLGAHDTVWVVAEHRMRGERHLLRLAPTLSAVAFDSGPLGGAPSQPPTLAVDGALAVIATGAEPVTLTAFSATAGALWRTTHAGWVSHAVLGAHVAVAARDTRGGPADIGAETWTLLASASGAAVATWPQPGGAS